MTIKYFLVLETLENRVNGESLETLGFAMSLCRDKSECALVIAGEDIRRAAEELAEKWKMDVIAVEDPGFEYPNGDLLAGLLEDIIREYSPECMVLLHTITGAHAAARTAALCGMDCITAVESIGHRDGRPCFDRAMQYGKIRASLAPTGGKYIVTILPGSFYVPGNEGGDKSSGTVYYRNLEIKKAYMPLGIERAESSRSLQEAEVIISGGRGIGNSENLELIRSVTGIFSRSAVGCSRPVCDLGWLPYGHQVGSTGKSVSPKLYMACGISGASQHLAGMKGSQLIVAVNKDPNAAIFTVADYGIVEDLTVFLPVLVEKYRELYGKEK